MDMKKFNSDLIDEFRANDGKVKGMFAEAPLVLITHTGAKSGRSITTPLVCTRDGDRVVIIASKGGAPENPAWYHNLVKNPKVTVELPGEKFSGMASEAKGAERDRLYAQQEALMPNFTEYRNATTRTIPVFVITRD